MKKKKAKTKSEDERKAALLSGNIRKHQEADEISDELIAAELSIHRDTYRRKRSHPNLFTYCELITIFKVLDFTDQEILESI